MNIDHASPIPLHYQIRRILTEEITRAVWEPGEALPSEPALAQRFGVSRMTVRQALRDLAERGLVLRQRGKSTRVAPQPIERTIGRFYTFAAEMEQLGRTHISRVLQVGLAPPTMAMRAALGLGEGEQVARITLLRLLDEEPLSLETAAFRSALLPVVQRPEVAHRSLYDLLEDAGTVVTRATERIRPVALSRADAKVLMARAGSPAFAIERTSYAGDTAIEWRESYLIGERYRFVAELRREQLGAP
jgi:GntR family transcriptional regulator